MMKKIIAILVTVIMLVSILSVNIFAANATNNITAIVSQDIVKLRNKAVNYKGFKIADNNYYKLRDIAKSLSDTPSKFEVLWNEKENAIEIITGKEYTAVGESNSKYYAPNRNYKASDTRSKVLVDGKLQSIKAYNIDDSNYFKLRDLGQVVGFDVEWDGNKNEIKILPSIAKGAYRLKSTYETDTYNYLTILLLIFQGGKVR